MDGLRNIQDEKFIYIYIYIKHCLHFITNSLLTFSQMLQTYLRYAHAFFQVPNWGGGGGGGDQAQRGGIKCFLRNDSLTG